MRRLFVLLMLAWQSLLHAADVPLESAIRADFIAFSTLLGVSPRLVLEHDGRQTRSEGDGTVVIGMAALRDIDSRVRGPSARFFLAHELWHQKQFQLYGSAMQNQSDEMARLHECQADVMGAVLVMETMSLEGGPEFLMTIADVAYSIGVPNHLRAKHPPPEQRRTAVKFGFTYGLTLPRFRHLIERDLKVPADEFVAALRKQVSFDDGMDLPNWSLQQCKLVTHYSSEALAGISTEQAEVRFNKDPKAPFVFYRVPYRNISARPIRLRFAIQSVMVSRKDPKEIGKQVAFALEPYVVDIAPGGLFEAAGTLPWYGDKDDYYPRLEFRPDSPRSLIAAEFIGEETQAQTCLGSSTRGGAQLSSQLNQALAKLVQDAENGFRAFRSGAGSSFSDSIYYASSVQIPGAKETEIELEQGGAARVAATLYEGNDGDRAHSVYATYKNALLDICPFGVQYKESKGSRGPDLVLSYSRKTRVHMYVYHNSERGVARVTFHLNATKW